MTNNEIKAWAKENYKKYQWKIVGATIIVSILTSINSAYSYNNDSTTISSLISFLVGLLEFFLTIGLTKFMVNLIKGKEANFEMLFSKFDSSWKQTILTFLLQMIWIAIYTLLLIVPGIIKAISYSLVPYILAKGTDASASEVLDLSAKMMNGHKMDYFILNLSFIGWHILGVLTLGILELWIIPYQQTANTKFLNDIMENYKEA